mmetsp:Transcript_63796/g.120818  ORF Transcript_63796/g.120818 Transcript_63796/m.120818 type:complete len:155 (+) Transcript_63796:2612-3076(+)
MWELPGAADAVEACQGAALQTSSRGLPGCADAGEACQGAALQTSALANPTSMGRGKGGVSPKIGAGARLEGVGPREVVLVDLAAGGVPGGLNIVDGVRPCWAPGASFLGDPNVATAPSSSETSSKQSSRGASTGLPPSSAQWATDFELRRLLLA